MKLETFSRTTPLPVSAEDAFAWHAREGALERLLPPWDDIRVVSRSGAMEDGGRVALSLPVGPVRLEWLAEYHDVEVPRQFCDVAIHGPFARWDHLHRFQPCGDAECTLTDRIEYACPGGMVGCVLGGSYVRRQLERMFRYRHATTAADLALHCRYADRPRMKVAMTGASGLIGSALRHLLASGGYEVVALHRDASNRIDVAAAEGADAVIHLAGENIAARRWSAEQKRRIMDSRVEVTRQLCEDLLELSKRPQALLSASAVGFYGSRGDEPLHETSSRGDGFLAEVCVGWEEATQAARQAGLRTVALRFGVVLSPKGGALRPLLRVFRLGAGGRIGSGTQWMSWVSLDDVVSAIYHAIMTDAMTGPVNVVAPNPVTNAEFARTLARVLHRPALAPVPAAAVKTAFGEMGQALLLSGQRVVPDVLNETGFTFRHSELETALRHMLGCHN